MDIKTAGFSHYNLFLVYCEYGHWHKHSLEHAFKHKGLRLGVDTLNFCGWNENYFQQFLKEIEFLKENLKPMDLKLKITSQTEDNKGIHTEWLIYDEANPFLSEKGAVLTQTKQGGLNYANERYATTKHLLGGCIEAFLKSINKKPCLMDWLPDSNNNRYGYKWVKNKNGDWKIEESLIPYCKEV